jgi:hypothetical protein
MRRRFSNKRVAGNALSNCPGPTGMSTIGDVVSNSPTIPVDAIVVVDAPPPTIELASIATCGATIVAMVCLLFHEIRVCAPFTIIRETFMQKILHFNNCNV